MDGMIHRLDSSEGIQCFVDTGFASGWSASDCKEPYSIYFQIGGVAM
jgi:hypothetical protein